MAPKRRRPKSKTHEDDGVNLPEEFIPKINISAIKNKVKRAEAYKKMKKEQKKVKRAKRKQEKKEAEAMGEDAPPKKVPKTIESMRVYDETMVDPLDDEVIADEGHDECANYFNRETTPKILITTCQRSSSRTKRFCQELEACLPNSTVVRRRVFKLKKVIPDAVEREYTDLIVINENRRKPDGMLICHLPDGPTANFRVSNVRFNKEIRKSGKITGHRPELILNNFNTRLGHSIGRMVASLFPHEPEFLGRSVVTFHNQRDYVFFRHHRYQFRNAKRVGLQELGPRFTLKLRSLQKGTFDTKYGEYEWVHKRHEMEASRRKFAL